MDSDLLRSHPKRAPGRNFTYCSRENMIDQAAAAHTSRGGKPPRNPGRSSQAEKIERVVLNPLLPLRNVELPDQDGFDGDHGLHDRPSSGAGSSSDMVGGRGVADADEVLTVVPTDAAPLGFGTALCALNWQVGRHFQRGADYRHSCSSAASS